MKRTSILLRQRGFGIVTAVFLVVTLASLAVVMLSLQATQQATTTLDVLSARAYLAAKAGAEWAVYRARISGACTASKTLTFSGTTTLSTFQAVVTCDSVVTLGVTRYYVVSTACNATSCSPTSPSADFVSRTVSVRFGG